MTNLFAKHQASPTPGPQTWVRAYGQINRTDRSDPTDQSDLSCSAPSRRPPFRAFLLFLALALGLSLSLCACRSGEKDGAPSSSVPAASSSAASASAASASAASASASAFQVKTIGSLGRQPGFFTKPRAVAFMPDHSLVVIDRSGRIQHLGKEGDFLEQWTLPAFDNGTPTGFDIDPRDSTLWVADTHYTQIIHYDIKGNILGKFGQSGTGPGQMIFPTCVALDPDDGTLWVSEYGQRNRILHFTASGEFLGEWGKVAESDADMLRPQSLRAAPKGDLFVADAGRHRVWRFKRGKVPEPISAWGEAGEAPGKLKYPYSIALAPDGTLYVLEYGNSRISHFTQDGKFLGCWGAPGHGSNQLYSPWGAAIDLDGRRIAIADTNNNRLLLVSPAP